VELDPIAAIVPAAALATPGEGSFAIGTDTAVTGVDGAASVAEHLASVFGLPLSPDSGAIRLAVGGDPAELGDEGYELTVTARGVRLLAAAPAGLFRAVQTLRQLRSTAGDLPVGRIVDRPRFAYRGVMLDVARHFFPVADVKRLIDVAALLKLNYLHLHLTDDQGWRIAIDQWSRLTEYGGGTEVGDGPGGYYTKADYREIVAYAADRFITVVPEVDLPGHTNAALASYPELNADGVAPDRYTGIGVGFSSLAVAKEITYQFLDEVFGELAALTPGPFMHIGGDEAKTLGPEDYGVIVARAQEIVAGHGKTVIGWHEIAAAKLLPSTVVQYWGVSGDDGGVAAAAAAGNRVIMSPADRTYLDMKYDEDTPWGLSWAGHISTEASYDWDPARYLSGVDEAAVLGVESPLWTETVDTIEQVEYLVLPRLAVTAELGWAPADRHDWVGLRERLGAQCAAWTALGISFYRAPEVPWREQES
jgi:N-acetyl-beta-hexosaminidase